MSAPTLEELHYAEMQIKAAQAHLDDERERWTVARAELLKVGYLHEGAMRVYGLILDASEADDAEIIDSDCEEKIDTLCAGLALDEEKARTAYKAIDAAVLAAYGALTERMKARDAIKSIIEERTRAKP